MNQKNAWIAIACCIAFTGFTATASAQSATCATQVAAMTQYGSNTNTIVGMTTNRANAGFRSSSSGTLIYDATSGWISGRVTQLFSDRYSGTQPFAIGAADFLNIWIRPGDGHLWINNLTWGGWQDFAPTCNVSGMILFSTPDTLYTLSFAVPPPPG